MTFFFSSSACAFKAIARSIASAASARASLALSRSSCAFIIEVLSKFVVEEIICASVMSLASSEDVSETGTGGVASIGAFSFAREAVLSGSLIIFAVWICFVGDGGTGLGC